MVWSEIQYLACGWSSGVPDKFWRQKVTEKMRRVTFESGMLCTRRPFGSQVLIFYLTSFPLRFASVIPGQVVVSVRAMT